MKRLLVFAAIAMVFAGSFAAAQSSDPVPKLLDRLKSKRSATRTNALIALADLGPSAAPAIPALAATLTGVDEEQRILAVMALGKIGKASLPAVEKLLDHEDESARYYAVWAIGLVGKDAREQAPRLLKIFAKDEDEEVRIKAAYALARIAPDSKEVLAHFAKLATDSEQYTTQREVAITELRHFGPGGIAPLVKAARDMTFAPQARDSLNHLLDRTRTDQAARAILPHVADLFPIDDLLISNPSPGDGLTWVLSRHGETLLPDLAKALAGKDIQKRDRAIWTLANMAGLLASRGENPALVKQSVKLLDPAFKAGTAVERQTVASLLPVNDDTAPGFEAMLLGGDIGLRFLIFSKYGEAGRDFVPMLQKKFKATKDMEEKVRIACVLLSSSEQTAEMYDFLLRQASSKDAAVRERCAGGLLEVARYASFFPPSPNDEAKVAKVLVPILVDALKNKQVERRLAAATALASAAYSLKAHVPALLAHLDDPSPQVQIALLHALSAHAATDAKASLAKIVPFLEHPRVEVRQAAIQAMSSLRKDAVPHLARCAEKDPDPRVWTQAMDQLSDMRRDAVGALPTLVRLADDAERGPTALFAIAQIDLDGAHFGALLAMRLKKDDKLRAGLAYPKDVLENSAKCAAALALDWKKADAPRRQKIADTTSKVFRLLPAKDQDTLAFAVSPLMSQELSALAKTLKAKDVKVRLDGVTMLAEIDRLWLAFAELQYYPRANPAGNEKELTQFNDARQKQFEQIEKLFARARVDPDLQVRRHARRLQMQRGNDLLLRAFGLGNLPPQLFRGFGTPVFP